MKQIPLTQGKFALVDDWNYEWLLSWSWSAKWDKHTQSYYAKRAEGKHPHQKTIYMAREIMKTPAKMVCDHINHDTLNNQEKNLRNVTVSQNNMNSRLRCDNELGEKNIYRNRKGYIVRIKLNKKSVFNKYFKTLKEAILARNNAFKTYRGEFLFLEKRTK